LHSANTAAGVLGRQPAADTGAETMRFGRRSRKRETPVAVIKRKIRIRYSKTGLMRFLTHSDIVRVFDRSAQLAKIPLVYSQGLRRNPKIAYGPPLPVNISSIAEYLDMEVEIGREVDLQSRFNQFLPEGLKILQFQEIYAKSPALAAIINRAMYEAYMPDGVISQEWINQWLAQPQAPAKRVSKEGTREVDIRPFLRGLEWADNRLLITIDSIEGKTAKVVEILESLLLPQGMDYRYFPVQRTGQFIVRDNEILTPFEVL
jgi:radical SAM-linked protein